MVFRAPFLTVLGACAVFSLAFGKNTTRSLSSLPGYSIPVNPSGFLGPQGNSLGEVFEYESLGIGWLNEPVVDASGNIYITFSSVYVVALSPTGTTLWSLSDSSGASLGQPVLATYGILMIPTTLGAFALNCATGQVQWEFPSSPASILPSTVTLDPDIDTTHSVFISGLGNNYMYSLNGGTGQIYWNALTAGGTADALAGNGVVIIAYPGVDVTGGSVSVTAYSGTTGLISWNQTLAQGMLYTLTMFQMDNQGNVYLAYASATVLTVTAFSYNGGTQLWTVTPPASDTFPGVYSTVGFTNLYIATSSSTIAYSLTTGQQVWTSTVGMSPLEPPVITCPGVLVYIVTGGLNTVQLAALSSTTGNVRWTFSDPQARGVFGAPVFDSAGTLYIESFSSTSGSTLYALNHLTGALLWQFSVDHAKVVLYDTALTIGQNVILMTDNDEMIAVGVVKPSSSAGAIAGGVIGTLLGLGLVAGVLWDLKVKKGLSFSFGGINKSNYTTIASGGSTRGPVTTGYSYTTV